MLIPKYGLECPILISKSPAFAFNEEEASVSVEAAGGPETLRLFDKVVVQLFLDEADAQHRRLSLALVQPSVPGFSAPSILDAPEPEPHDPCLARN